MAKKVYVFAGASNRCLNMYALPMLKEYQDVAELKGVYDINPGRSRTVSERCGGIPVYEDFTQMMQEVKPDVVIVTTVDAFHSDYIIQSMEMGADVITEKPMTITADRCRAILEAEQRTGRKVTVTFNYRYAPFATKIKELISSGAIGDVFSVHFEWMLDRVQEFGAHGTSYFHRWNARMAKSGGLLVHKSTHHFDLINWWIGQDPEKVAAFAKLNLYGPKNRLFKGERCSTCPHAKECPYSFEPDEQDKFLYFANEQYDGYLKDNCVFADDIDIYDTMSVNVQYTGGAVLSYSLNATAAYEGWRMSINGSKGRLEAFLPETGIQSKTLSDTIKVFDLNNNVTEYNVTRVTGGHGGGDVRLRNMLFRDNVPDPMGHSAGSLAGANSIMVGAAANVSIKEGRVVDIAELLGSKELLHR